MSQYVRNTRGTVFHRADCKRVSPASHPWNWAEGRTPEGIYLRVPWTKPCKFCIPELQP